MDASNLDQLENLVFDDQGLIPAIVQDWRDGTVLMFGFMNQEAVRETLRSHSVHFWSRSRNQLWQKGETSGHYLRVKKLFIDCDHDTILVKAEPVGPTCHTGNPTCFFQEMEESATIRPASAKETHGGILERLYEMTLERKRHSQEGSYVSSLLEGGTDRILKKVAEEAGEVLLASKNRNREEIIYEVADLFFHTIVMLGDCEVSPEEIWQELGKRFGKSGLRKKDGRHDT